MNHSFTFKEGQTPRAENLDWVFYERMKNEDAEPYLGKGVAAVADGMGGAGAAVHELTNSEVLTAYDLASAVLPPMFTEELPFVKRQFAPLLEANLPMTSAFWASRIVMCRFIFAMQHMHVDFANDESRAVLSRFMHEGLLQAAHTFGFSAAANGALKLLPTTFAAVKRRTQGNRPYVSAIWAGDSRCYVWGATSGLRQLSDDDEDETGCVTNKFSADAPFPVLHGRTVGCEEPVLLFCCSDGIFDNFEDNPLALEALLLQAMQGSRSAREFCDRVRRIYARIKGDDCTLALLNCGFTNYEHMRITFAARAKKIEALSRAKETFAMQLQQYRDPEQARDCSDKVRYRVQTKAADIAARLVQTCFDGTFDPCLTPRITEVVVQALHKREEEYRRTRESRGLQICSRLWALYVDRPESLPETAFDGVSFTARDSGNYRRSRSGYLSALDGVQNALQKLLDAQQTSDMLLGALFAAEEEEHTAERTCDEQQLLGRLDRALQEYRSYAADYVRKRKQAKEAGKEYVQCLRQLLTPEHLLAARWLQRDLSSEERESLTARDEFRPDSADIDFACRQLQQFLQSDEGSASLAAALGAAPQKSGIDVFFNETLLSSHRAYAATGETDESAFAAFVQAMNEYEANYAVYLNKKSGGEGNQ